MWQQIDLPTVGVVEDLRIQNLRKNKASLC